ncbi:hypothetical protein ABW19_dt0207327 [Dactylella cylindrospora]|nr:hypothetical protein ABW19_dt0207327 [Dactylella cylindrospora]
MAIQDSNDPQTAKLSAESPSMSVKMEADAANCEADNSQKSTMRTIFLLISVLLSMFLVALDRTIISTAIPQITDEFNSLTDVGWYGSVYLLTCCAFQLLFGKLYSFYSVKGVLLTSILLFEIASALCGAAPSSLSFIIGRAVSGVGAAGIFAGTIVSIVHLVPLRKRPQIQGLFGALFGIASIVGPLIGGAFTSNVTWRWCFYINLPIGAVAMLVIAFCLEIPERDATSIPWADKLSQLDAPGTALLVPGVVCLLLALHWGGQTYAVVYFLPIWFQSIKDFSAVESGIRLLPVMLSMVVGSITGGITTSKVGYYTPFAIVGSCIMSVGAGLLTTLQVDTSESKWIGYQVLYGIGMGLCFQVPNLAAQTVLPKSDVPIGLALMFFGQLLGAAVFVAVGENVLGNQLAQRLSRIPGLNSSLVESGGATSLISSLPAGLRERVLIDYNEALRKVFQVGLVMSCLSVPGAALLEWKSILKESGEGPSLRADATGHIGRKVEEPS